MRLPILLSGLTFILLLVLLLGSRMIFAGDFFFLADQARDMLLVQDIVDNKNLTLIGTHSGLGGFFHGPLWLYMLIPFYLIGGGDPFVFTYAYVMIALITVLVGYFVGNALYGKKAGLVFAFILAISPSIWLQVPNTIGVNMVPLVFLPMFYFLIRYMRGHQNSYIFAVFFAGLSLQFETALPLIILPVVAGSFFLNRKAIKNIKLIILSVVSLVVSLATFILFDLKHNFLMTRALSTLFTSTEKGQGYLMFPDRFFSHFQSLIDVYGTVLITKSLLLQSILVIIIALFLYLVYKNKLHKKKEWKEFLYLLLFPAVIFTIYLFYGYPVFIEYVLGLTVPVALALTIAIQFAWRNKIGKIFVILFLGISLFEAGKIVYRDYFTPYQMNTTAGSYREQKEVTEWLVNDSNGKEFGYYVYTASTYTYGMDYLLWWETRARGLAKPENRKLPTTYLILYPPLENDEGAHAFWKRTKVRTQSEVVGKKTFDSGIIVEKLSVKPGEPDIDPTLNQNLIFR